MDTTPPPSLGSFSSSKRRRLRALGGEVCVAGANKALSSPVFKIRTTKKTRQRSDWRTWEATFSCTTAPTQKKTRTTKKNKESLKEKDMTSYFQPNASCLPAPNLPHLSQRRRTGLLQPEKDQLEVELEEFTRSPAFGDTLTRPHPPTPTRKPGTRTRTSCGPSLLSHTAGPTFHFPSFFSLCFIFFRTRSAGNPPHTVRTKTYPGQKRVFLPFFFTNFLPPPSNPKLHYRKGVVRISNNFGCLWLPRSLIPNVPFYFFVTLETPPSFSLYICTTYIYPCIILLFYF